MKPYRTDHAGQAEFNSWTALPSGSIPGAYRQDNGRHFAKLVYIAGGSGQGSSSDNLTDNTLVPLTGYTVAVSGATPTDLGTILPTAKVVRLSFTGSGDIRLTYDGSTPVGGSNGEVWFKGGLHTVNPIIADSIKVIKDGSSAGAIYVTQFA